MVNEHHMLAQLVLHEGIRLRVYLDTEGFETIGVGYNVSARGWDFLERTIGRKVTAGAGDLITRDEALKVCAEDIARVQSAVLVHWPYYAQLSEVRQRVAIDMAFNLGLRALGFRNAIAAIERNNWSKASRELYKSKWANQVGDGVGGKFDRCDRLARMLLTGQEPTDIPAI
jgi:lysozyme